MSKVNVVYLWQHQFNGEIKKNYILILIFFSQKLSYFKLITPSWSLAVGIRSRSQRIWSYIYFFAALVWWLMKVKLYMQFNKILNWRFWLMIRISFYWFYEYGYTQHQVCFAMNVIQGAGKCLVIRSRFQNVQLTTEVLENWKTVAIQLVLVQRHPLVSTN